MSSRNVTYLEQTARTISDNTQATFGRDNIDEADILEVSSVEQVETLNFDKQE